MASSKEKKPKMKKEQMNVLLKVVMFVLFVTGAAVFSYPFISDAINNYYDQKNLAALQVETEKQNIEQLQKQKEDLAAKNAELLAQGKLNNIPGMGLVEDPFDEAIGNQKSPGREYFEEYTVGAIYIPSIHVSLPLFRETNNLLLEKGATILQGTSFPIGGPSTHSVITGHSAIPEKKLFTDLEKLKAGDLFFVDIAGEKLAYEIFEFDVVLPHEFESLVIQDGEDLVTLLTCTPYMINTHRLLVTGKRVPYPEEEIKAEVKATQQYHRRRFQIYMLLIPIFFALTFYWMWRKYVYYQSLKGTYNFEFYYFENGSPVSDIVFTLVGKRDKPVLNPLGEPFQARSDTKGLVSFKQVPGGIYRAISADQSLKVRGEIWLLKDSIFMITMPLLKRKVIKTPIKAYQINEVKKDGK
ncbi:hypothetical protein GCM10011482_05620 [Enterococcus alcedinis]|uniref:Class C sortase n=2 Tax=Enterococcus alcedinis TaxID=1274384 RepID=A0A917N3U3_9ENTE|nr:class C sortase [Enterococcus alcedinis]MBP2100794.1 sortase A [Enterococcus alcedinis]GGI64908.1 hypothetical protein GCM10011482_05620 [Enterococcus alcedinis]